MSLMSQPARGGSRMTVWSWVIYSRASSDLARIGVIRECKSFSFSGRSSRPSSRGSSLRPRSNCGCPSKENNLYSREEISSFLAASQFLISS